VVVLCVLAAALPAHAGPGPNWIGDWIDPQTGDTLAITPEALVAQSPPDAPTRYVWADTRHQDIAAMQSGGLPPGNYSGYDATPMTRDEILAWFMDTWKQSYKGAEDPSADPNFKKVLAAIGAIPPGRYARLRLFCVDDPKVGYDCSIPDEDEFFILLGDHIMKLHLELVAPEDSEIATYQRR